MLLKLYKIGVKCRFLPVTYVISSSYIPRELFMCYVTGVANSGKRKYAAFFTVTYGVFDWRYLVSFFRGKLLKLFILDKGFLMVQVCWIII